MKNPVDEWKKIKYVLDPDEVKKALELFLGDWNMAKQNPSLETYKLVIEARARAVKAADAVLKDLKNKGVLGKKKGGPQEQAEIFFNNKMQEILNEHQLVIGKKVKQLDQEVTDEVDKLIKSLDQALAHKNTETLKIALADSKRFPMFLDGLPKTKEDRLTALRMFAVTPFNNTRSLMENVKEAATETDGNKKTALLEKVRKGYAELQENRMKLEKIARTGTMPKVLG